MRTIFIRIFGNARHEVVTMSRPGTVFSVSASDPQPGGFHPLRLEGDGRVIFQGITPEKARKIMRTWYGNKPYKEEKTES